MDGKTLKNKLADMGYKNVSELARLLGMNSPQNLHIALSAQDIKSGFLEELANVLGVSVCDFYSQSAKADNGIAVSGGSVESPVVNNAISESLVQSMLDTKDKQIDRLLTIIEGMQK
jgi:hypothetical protein